MASDAVEHSTTRSIRIPMACRAAAASLALWLATCAFASAAHSPHGQVHRPAEPRDELGRTPLMLAARAGDLAEVRRLARLGAVIDSRSRGRWTPLMYAVDADHPDVVTFLLAHGANPRARGREDTSALESAWEKEDSTVLEALVRAGANVNDPRDNLLANAASLDRLALAAELLRLGARPDGVRPYMRPLELAIMRRQAYADAQISKMVALLLHAGAKPTGEDLLHAMYVERHDPGRPMTELLLQAGVSASRADSINWTPLHHAVLNEDVVVVGMLLAHGADLNAEDDFHRTPLTLAVQKGNNAMVKLLLARGADTAPRSWSSALSSAADMGRSDMVKLLQDAGAGAGPESTSNLAQAARRLDLAAVKQLLAIGADPNAQPFGWTPLGLAVGSPQVLAPKGGWADAASLREPTLAMVKLFLALPNLSQATKDNALLHAADRQPLEIVRLLVEAGASPAATSKNFGNVRDNAARNPDPAVAELLRSH